MDASPKKEPDCTAVGAEPVFVGGGKDE